MQDIESDKDGLSTWNIFFEEYFRVETIHNKPLLQDADKAGRALLNGISEVNK